MVLGEGRDSTKTELLYYFFVPEHLLLSFIYWITFCLALIGPTLTWTTILGINVRPWQWIYRECEWEKLDVTSLRLTGTWFIVREFKKKNHLHCRPMFFYRKASVHLTAVLLNMLTFHWNHVHGGSKTVKQDTNVDRRVKQKKNLSGNPASSVSSPLTGLHGLQNPVLASLASSPPSSSPCLTCFCRQNWIHCNARKSSGRL